MRTSAEAAAAKMRVPMEILITRIGSAGSEQQAGCSQASNCHGTETGHNVLSETCMTKVPDRGRYPERIVGHLSPDRVTFGQPRGSAAGAPEFQ